MDSHQLLKIMAMGVREIHRKLDDLARLEMFIVSGRPPAATPEIFDKEGNLVSERLESPDLEDHVEDVRLWCSHVALAVSQYLHPSLGRFFLDDVDRRLKSRRRRDLPNTVRWVRKTVLQILADSTEHAQRLPLTVLAFKPPPAFPSDADLGPVGASGTGIEFLDIWGTAAPPDTHASVFVIHGHDKSGTTDLVNLLRARYVVRTVVMQTRTLPTATLPEKFEICAKECNLAIALLTPDDMGARIGDDSHAARVRQNVLVELGWFWGRCGRHSVLLISRGTVDLPSDLAGLQPVRYSETIEEVVLDIDAFMRFHQVSRRET